MSKLFEVKFTRTQTATYQVYAEDWETAECKARDIMSDDDFITHESAGDLEVDTDEIEAVLSKYCICTNVFSFDIYAYNIGEAIDKVREMLRPDVKVLEESCYPYEDTEEDCEYGN